MIGTKPIVSYRVDIYSEGILRGWFEIEYRLVLETTRIRHGKFIHNINKKGARIYIPAGEEIVIPIRIKKMYTGIPENRLSVRVIDSISTDRGSILPVIYLVL
jgi:hypothetical protein